MDMAKYRDLFLSETREHLNQMGRLLVALEQAPAEHATIDALFREAHSVKGMAASMGYDRTASLAHHLEDTLDGFRRGGAVPGTAIDRLLAGIDLLEGLLDDLQGERPERDIAGFLAGEPTVLTATAVDEEPPAEPVLLSVVAPPGETEAEEDGAPGPATVSVAAPVGVVFQVVVELSREAAAPAARGLLILRELERIGEVLSVVPTKEALRQGGECLRLQAWLRTAVPRLHLEEALRAIDDVDKVGFIDDRRNEGGRRQAAGGRSVRVRTDLLDQLVDLSGELLTRRYMLQRSSRARDWDGLEEVLDQAARLIDELYHRALQVRLMPLESITGRLPRLVRDLSRTSGKKVDFKLVGGDVGLDRVILEELADPLVHLVRNAIDHGIDRAGEVVIAARRERDMVLIEVGDNGRGIDPGLLRRKAVERRILTAPQAELLADREALMLICVPGFSTAGRVTETSGRGVGMDVVKAAVDKLGGTLEIHSSPGNGTRFQLRLPLSAAIIRILQVDCSGHPLALPLTRVARTLERNAADIRRDGEQRLFTLADEELPLMDLAELLGLPATRAEESLRIVLTEVQGRRLGLQVARFLGQRDAFVKPLGLPFNLQPGLSGATIEADGSVLFIFDPQALLEGTALPTPA